MLRSSRITAIKCFLIVSSLAATLMSCQEPAQKDVGNGIPDESTEILIKFKAGTPQDSIQALTAKLRLEKVREISAIGVHVYRPIAGVSAQQALREAQSSPHVEYAEPNVKYKIPEKN